MEPSELYNEKQVLLALSQGCSQAFGQVYHHYAPRLHARLVRLLRSEAIAEEILQDVFLSVWKNRYSIDTQKSFCSYIFCIATSRAYDHFRKNLCDRRMLSHMARTGEQHMASAESNILQREAAGQVHEAIALLPPKRREVFVLCKMDGKSYEEVSHQLGISTSTISDHIVKANLFLKRYLTQTDA